MSEQPLMNYHGYHMPFYPIEGCTIDRLGWMVMILDPNNKPVLCLGIMAAKALADALAGEIEEFELEVEAEAVMIAEEGDYDD